jgi:hypothetical protein
VLDRRIDGAEADWPYFHHIAERLVSVRKLIRAGHMTSHFWAGIAKRLAGTHTKVIAEAILDVHCRGGGDTWFIEHTEAEKILQQLVEVDAKSVWNALLPHLSDRARAIHLRLGFPLGVLDRAPRGEVLAWADDDPDLRVPMLVRMVVFDLANADSLARALLDRYGHLDVVRKEFTFTYTSGSWTGPASEHWEGKAQRVEKLAKEAGSAPVRLWAAEALVALRQMAKQDRKNEQEEDIGR